MKISPYIMPCDKKKVAISVIAHEFGFNVGELNNSCRKKEMVYAKKAMIYILVNLFRCKCLHLVRRERLLNYKNHTTIKHHYEDALWLVENNLEFKNKINKIKSIINYGGSN